MFLKYHIICSHVYCYSNRSITPPPGLRPIIKYTYFLMMTNSMNEKKRPSCTYRWICGLWETIGWSPRPWEIIDHFRGICEVFLKNILIPPLTNYLVKHDPLTWSPCRSFDRWRNAHEIYFQNHVEEDIYSVYYNVCHVGEEMPVDFTTNTFVSCMHLFIQGWLHDGKHLHVCRHDFILLQWHAHHTDII